MARTKRLLLDNACYHIITRRNEQGLAFRSEGDYRKYLHLLLNYKRRYGFKLYGWCLMRNHVHLLMQSHVLSKVMHGISLSYARYFRHTYGSSGHFWQDRYKSYVIQKDQYLINCLTYIEYNPLRSNIASRPEDYQWSSYAARILGKQDGLLDVFIL